MSYFSLFQSPHPVRGATGSRSCWPPSQCHFNPRTPRGVRLIRSARVASNTQGFQSTHPARGATVGGSSPPDGSRISIHAPREGCDVGAWASVSAPSLISIHAPREGCDQWRPASPSSEIYLNPPTPRGVRPPLTSLFMVTKIFQSTHPARGATFEQMEERITELFQSTHPARGATLWCRFEIPSRDISIHAPREGCD